MMAVALPDEEMAALRLLAREDRAAMKARTKLLGLRLSDRLRLENSLIKTATATSPRRVCLVCTANAFVYDDSPSKQLAANQQGGEMRLRPTGGLTLTYSLVRFLKQKYGATIIALDYVFVDEPPCVKL